MYHFDQFIGLMLISKEERSRNKYRGAKKCRLTVIYLGKCRWKAGYHTKFFSAQQCFFYLTINKYLLYFMFAKFSPYLRIF